MPRWTVSTVEVALDVLREAPEPMAFQELLAAVNAVEPIRTNNPTNTLRSAISNTRLIGKTGDGRYGFLPSLASGSTLRHVLTKEDLSRSYLALGPDVLSVLWPAQLEVQKRQDQSPRRFELPDGQIILAPLEFFGAGIWGISIEPVIAGWLTGSKARDGDSLILHLVDGKAGYCQVSFEQRRKRNNAQVASRNKALADVAYDICKASASDSLLIDELARRLVARGAYQDPRPPDPLVTVLSSDTRFADAGLGFLVKLSERWGPSDDMFRRDREATIQKLFPRPPDPKPGVEIARLIMEGRSQEAIGKMQEAGFIRRVGDEVYVDMRGAIGSAFSLDPSSELFPPIPGRKSPLLKNQKKRSKKEMAREVYCFKAALQGRKRVWRRIEVRGDQTLGDLDSAMRKAFSHDTFDHLSEFHLGVGRDWKSYGLGYHAPDGSGEGDRVVIGDIGLSQGDHLMYVYDFGDYIVHQLTLEQVGESEQGVEYPRIIARNKPKYSYCEICQSKGKQTVAEWVCVECSNEQGQLVLVCEECLEQAHEDHYAEEMVY